MSSHFKISIPEPCSEDWNKMIPNESGRFCESCAKTVVDFTTQSKEEIQAFFSQNQSKKICGRFNNEQLNRFDIQIPAAVLRERRSFHQAFLLALFVVMGASLFSCKNHSNNQLGEVVVVEDTIKENVTMGVILPPKEVMDSLMKVKKDSETKRNIPPPPPPPPRVKELNFKNTEVLKKYVTGEIIHEPIPDSIKTEKN